jgi:hypothetical protein
VVLARQTLLPSLLPTMSISPKAKFLPMRITRAVISASWFANGFKKLLLSYTVVMGRCVPS